MIAYLRRLVGLNRPAGSVQYEIYGLRQCKKVYPQYTNENNRKPSAEKAGDSGENSWWDYQHKVFWLDGWLPISEVKLALMSRPALLRFVGVHRHAYSLIDYTLDIRR